MARNGCVDVIEHSPVEVWIREKKGWEKGEEKHLCKKGRKETMQKVVKKNSDSNKEIMDNISLSLS